MFLDQIRSHCLGFPGAEEDHPWGENVWKVGGRVFCFGGLSGASVTVKTSRDRQEALIQDPAVSVAPYLGRHGWVSVALSDETLAMALELIGASYDDVVAGLPKSHRPRSSPD